MVLVKPPFDVKIKKMMIKNKIVNFFIAIGIIAVFLFFYTYDLKTSTLTINDRQKESIIKYVYDILDKEKNPVLKMDMEYDKIFITLFSQGKTLCSQSGSVEITEKNRISKDIFQAVEKCLKEIKAKEISPTDVVIDILYNEKKVEGTKIITLAEEIELGINAVKLEDGKNVAFFKASYPIEKRYSLQSAIEKLCQKVKLKKTCYKDSEVSLYKYNSLSFKGNRETVVNLYRNSQLVNLSDISQQYISKSIANGYEWFKNNVDQKTNMLNYLYYPERDIYSKEESHGRRLAAVWAMGELSRFLQKQDLQETIYNTLDYYINFLVEKNGIKYIKINSDSRMVYDAFLMLALLEQKEYPNRDKIMKDMAEAILKQQRENGSFNTDFEKEMAEDDLGNDYYPGEAMLSLMRLYNETGEEKYKQSVEKAFLYYREYWRAKKNTAFIPWHTQTYKLLFEETGNKELTDFVFEMNDWVVANYQKFSSPYSDYVGGFGKNPTNSTASYLEGLADAYYLAKKVGDQEHILKYAEACKYAARFVLQTQFKEGDVFYLSNPQRALGGFKQSPINISQRNDYTQHSTLSLIKVYQNNIFSDAK